MIPAGNELSRLWGFRTSLPRGRDTDVVVVAIVPTEETKPAAAKVTNSDAATIRRNREGSNIDPLKEPNAPDLIESCDEPAHLANVWNFLVLREKLQLLVPVLVSRVGHWFFTYGLPATETLLCHFC